MLHFSPIEIFIIKSGYVYLLILAAVASVRSLYIMVVLNEIKGETNKLLRFISIAICYLSIIQIYQSINMIQNHLDKGWWIPFICKHGALIIYHILLSMIAYKINHPDVQPDSNRKINTNPKEGENYGC